MTSRAWSCALFAAVVVVVASCGSGGSNKSGAASTPTAAGATATTRPAAVDTYCARIREYANATSTVDMSSLQSAQRSLVAAAVAARGAAEAAPPAIHAQQGRLADEAQDLVKEIDRRDPKTVDDLRRSFDEVGASLKSKYPQTASDSDAIKKYAHDNCGMETG